ncbi:MAG: hypothetical protein ACI9B9_000523 [Halioglobus sp.]|jgi:hypothetical protein
MLLTPHHHRRGRLVTAGGLLATALLSASGAWAQTQLLWGDTHLHSSFSVDAYMAGNRSLDPDAGYRYAKGEPVVHPYNRTRVQIQQPLDFLAVADHAEYLGIIPLIMSGDFEQPEAGFFQRIKSWVLITMLDFAIEDPLAGTKRFTGLLPEPQIQSGDSTDPIAAAIDAGTDGGLGSLGLIDDDAAKRISASQWTKSMQIADRHNKPGEFTALVGWEWSQTASGANLHRIVVSDMDGSTAAGIDPIGSDDAPYPQDLWEKLETLSIQTNADFISIPHNSNLSKGYMFAKTTLKGEAINADYARTRMKWEPLVEATQIKGDSETHPDLAPDDEFAEFERFEFYLQAFPQSQGYKIQQGDTVRSALKSGLELQKDIGVNPFKVGMIGSTDAHTSIASAEESNFWGKVATDSTPATKRRNDPSGFGDGKQGFNGWNMSASGLAAVWSANNSRESIIAAMKRRETYATTGPRIQVRLFGGWDFTHADAQSAEIASIGYAGGVPMGGELTAAPDETAPHFLLRATRGTIDHNLDRIQIIKGWTDASGKAKEKIFNVAWSGDRQLDGNGKLPTVGNTANIRTGKTTNTIGAAELGTVWIDPEFNPAQSAFYYARVLQIPTVRHSQLDAIALAIDTPYEGPATLQERAYTSPIWYNP